MLVKKPRLKATFLLVTLLTLLTCTGLSFADMPESEFLRLADSIDARMFNVFTETVQMVNARNFEGLSKYFSKAALDGGAGTKKEVAIAALIYPSRSFKIQPFDYDYNLSFPIDWKADPYRNTSWVLWYQNLSWLDGTLAKAENGDAEAAKYAFKVIEEWIVSNTAWPAKNGPYVYDDHGSSERLKILGRALRIYRKSAMRDELFHNLLLTSILNHIAFLSSEEHYYWYNHGIMMDVALLEVLRDLDGFSDRKEIQELAVQRVTRQFQYAYTDEGVHKEHSACYHVWVTAWLLQTIDLLEQSSLASRGLTELAHRAAEYNTFIITKGDASFPAIGDCSDNQNALLPDEMGKKFYQSHPETLFAVTNGERGTKPASSIKVFPNSGVAVFRDKWPSKISATVQSSFHSEVHKHEDDTSFILSAHGKDLVIDAGLHTYENKPLDVYSWKARAHNVLIVDGRDFDFDLGNIGLSGITRSRIDQETSTGIVELTHPHYDRAGVKIFRQFAQLPGSAYVVRDLYESKSDHEYTQLLHLAPDAQIQHKGGGVFKVTWKNYPYALWVKSSFDVHGITAGSLNPAQGWYFPKFGESVAAPVLKLHRKGQAGEFTTYLSVAEEGKEPDWDRLEKPALEMFGQLDKAPRKALGKEFIPKTLVPTRKVVTKG